jgi:hypothetical protein
MKDKAIRRDALERQALLVAGVRAFVLTAGSLKGPEMAAILVAHLPRITRLALRHPAPFVAGVTRSSVKIYRLP